MPLKSLNTSERGIKTLAHKDETLMVRRVSTSARELRFTPHHLA